MNENTSRIPAFICWGCGKLNDAATDSDSTGAKPFGGAWCICKYCNHVAIFNDDLSVRQLTSLEWDEVFKDDNLLAKMRVNARLMRFLK